VGLNAWCVDGTASLNGRASGPGIDSELRSGNGSEWCCCFSGLAWRCKGSLTGSRSPRLFCHRPPLRPPWGSFDSSRLPPLPVRMPKLPCPSSFLTGRVLVLALCGCLIAATERLQEYRGLRRLGSGNSGCRGLIMRELWGLAFRWRRRITRPNRGRLINHVREQWSEPQPR
jgi:hypothetical protein